MQDIHDIKGLIGLDFPWFGFFALLLFFAGLLLVGIWLIQRWRKRKQKPKAAHVGPPAPRVDPRELALRELKKLKPDAAHPGQFYLHLEKILKEFLEGIHHQPVTGFTAQQLSQFLQHQTHASLQDAQLEHLLLHGQQAKFAAMPLSSEDMQKDLERTLGFVKTYTL